MSGFIDALLGILQLFGTIFAIGCIVFTSWFLILFFRNLNINNTANQQVVKDLKQFNNTIKIVYCEPVRDAFHMYNKITEEFIVKAKNKEEAFKKAGEMYPEYTFVDADGDPNEETGIDFPPKG
tara:strand:+ start:289 stop:660 length:372 start_codon:yes stop_codon:yes gene_type:complete